MPRKAKAPNGPSPEAICDLYASLRKRLSAWYMTAARDLPWRRNTSAYAVLVSEFMLQQTQVKTVIPYFERWMTRFPTFSSLAAAPEADVLHAWQGLGYYSRARNLHKTAKVVLEKHGGVLPDDLAAIALLPGVGPYTQGAISSFAFDRPTVAIDVNIARVFSRIFNIRQSVNRPDGVAKLQEVAQLCLPKSNGRLHTSSLMELGALVCTPKKPRCSECPVSDLCTAEDPTALPVKAAQPRRIELKETCGWITHGGAVLLEQQEGTRWKGLWKLPALLKTTGVLLLESSYPFTHHIVRLAVYRSLAPVPIPATCRWIERETLNRTAMPSPHRRALDQLLQDGRDLRV